MTCCGWGRLHADKRPQTVIFKEAHVRKDTEGWGIWVFYADDKRWYRMAMHSWDEANKKYWVSVLGPLLARPGQYLSCWPL